MSKWRYTKGLHDLGNGSYAYLQPDGSWGWSNAGLVVDSDHSLLVDTLFDLKLTRTMLSEMRRATEAAASIDTLVNTHANGDHCWGNQLLQGAEIVASSAAAQEMAEASPTMLVEMMRAAPELGLLGEYLMRIFGRFDFGGITLTPPTRTFDQELRLKVGDKEVALIEVGPAHTRGDILVYVPTDRTVFTGDILFVQGHPILWVGPVKNWVRACQRIMDMEVETVVPGHGPIADKNGVRELKDYLEYITAEARKRYDAGMSVSEAARDIVLDDYSSWGDAERVVVNVNTLYREFSGDDASPDLIDLFRKMAELAA